MTTTKMDSMLVKAGDVVRILTRMRAFVRVETAFVARAECGEDEHGKFMDVSYYPSGLYDSVRCSWGVAKFRETAREWGVVAVDIVGHRSPKVHNESRAWMAGHAGYDLG